MNLTEQVVLITGGSRGLGRAFAQALVAAGARVAITARGASELHEIAAQLSSAADQVIAIPADVVDPEAAPRVVAETEQRLGPITLLINNAGQFRAFGRIGGMDPLEWWNEVEVNLKGPYSMPTPCFRACVHAVRGGSSMWPVSQAYKPYPYSRPTS